MGKNDDFIDFESFDGGATNVAEGTDNFFDEENMLKAAINKKSAFEEIGLLYKSAKNDDEKIEIRQKILQTSYPNDIKSELLDSLDETIKDELNQEIALANSLREIEKDNSSSLVGFVGIVVIGFVVSIWFPIAWIIGIVLAVLGYFSSKKENAEKLKNARKAVEKVEKYRSAGYRI